MCRLSFGDVRGGGRALLKARHPPNRDWRVSTNLTGLGAVTSRAKYSSVKTATTRYSTLFCVVCQPELGSPVAPGGGEGWAQTRCAPPTSHAP